jgi:type VI secretion system protein ImpK
MTDFDDPFGPVDPRQRPRPGAGRRGMPDTGGVRPSELATVEVGAMAPSSRDWLGLGLNPLVRAASPLLLLIGQLRGSPTPMDASGLRRQALEEIRRFEEQARAAGVQHETVLPARYALCTALDEAVLSTPWGVQSEWFHRQLLVQLHGDAWGGEKYFDMVDRAVEKPERHIDLLELLYLGLALGFTGKYQREDRGQEQLADLQRDLYRRIREYRGPAPSELSLQWRGVEDRRHRLIRYVPWWVVASAGLAVIAVMFGVYYSKLADQSAPLHLQLGRIGIGDFAVPPPAPALPGPTLKQLLARDKQTSALRVEERGAQTIVTLSGPNVFESANATVNPAYEPVLDSVARALNQVPGRVLVRGYTDDRPIQTVLYPDNFALSAARARSVVEALSRVLENPARLTSTGLGKQDPVVENKDAGSRARNRRVEIVHNRGS